VTALHTAAYHDNAEALKMLLDARAALWITCYQGFTQSTQRLAPEQQGKLVNTKNEI